MYDQMWQAMIAQCRSLSLTLFLTGYALRCAPINKCCKLNVPEYAPECDSGQRFLRILGILRNSRNSDNHENPENSENAENSEKSENSEV